MTSRYFLVILLLFPTLRIVHAKSGQSAFFAIDKTANSWMYVKYMKCTLKMFEGDFNGLVSCFMHSMENTESVMVGANDTHCALCYYQTNEANFNASEFQGNLFMRRGRY